MSYTTVDAVAEIVARLGKGSLLAEVDIESAYRLIPVHPQDRILQAVRWRDRLYVDPMFPFGLRSALKIFNAVADSLNWLPGWGNLLQPLLGRLHPDRAFEFCRLLPRTVNP